MKKRAVLLVSFILFALASGCDTVKDATDVTFTVAYETTFLLVADSPMGTVRYDLDLSTEPEFEKYKSTVRDIKIDFLRYSITSNTGGGGKVDFYVNTFGGSFDTAKNVAETVSFLAGETRGLTDVVWKDKAYLESLLPAGRLSLWAAGEAANINLTLPAKIQLKVTANPLP